MNLAINDDFYKKLPRLYLDKGSSLLYILNLVSPYTYEHSQNVAIYSVVFGQYLNFSETQTAELYCAGLFHDVGKLGLDQELLLLKRNLTHIEKIKIMRHIEIGKCLLELKDFPEKIIEAAYLHHERYDGNGYLGFSGSSIPIYAQIVSLCDTLEALTSDRPYREKTTLKNALKIMEKTTGQFEPKLLKKFIDYMSNRI